jgi:hypothetical protein
VGVTFEEYFILNIYSEYSFCARLSQCHERPFPEITTDTGWSIDRQAQPSRHVLANYFLRSVKMPKSQINIQGVYHFMCYAVCFY